MRGTKIWLLGGLTALVLSGCGLLPGTERTETEEVHVGDTVSTSWFDYTITSAQSADSYQDRTADEGCKLIVVELTIQNRFDEPVPLLPLRSAVVKDLQKGQGEVTGAVGDLVHQGALPGLTHGQAVLLGQLLRAVGLQWEGPLVLGVFTTS